jgi:hypothetical protein
MNILSFISQQNIEHYNYISKIYEDISFYEKQPKTKKLNSLTYIYLTNEYNKISLLLSKYIKLRNFLYKNINSDNIIQIENEISIIDSKINDINKLVEYMNKTKSFIITPQSN